VGFDSVEHWTVPDGAKLAVRTAAPDGEGCRGVLLLLHGWGDHSGRFAETAAHFARAGLAVYAFDQRGHGRSPGKRGHISRFAQYLADVVALRRRIAAERPSAPQVLLGHSFGAFVVLRYLETAPDALAGAIAVAPYVDLARPPARWRKALARALGDLAPAVPIPTGLDYPLLSRDPGVWQAVRADPLCHQVITPRAYRELTDARGTLPRESGRISVPLLVLLAGEDRIVSTRAARELVVAVKGDVTVREYEGMYHDVFHEPGRERMLADIDAWLARVLPAARAA
jgi:alpha-beta hydrolase superfamily lysophospholipase